MTDLDRLATALADRYRIERQLGAGGMATVYLAEDLKHKRRVAVKVLRPELAAALGHGRFVQEITTTANLQHPHILPLFDSGEADSFIYYVMPFVEGETLRDRLDCEGRLSIDDCTSITTAVASALDYAHERRVIHRDIKPENILLQNGFPLVADFGIALAASAAGGDRITETGLSLGTPRYMSPEQIGGEREIDGRSDLYSLACVTYEMLSGDPPFLGSSAQAIMAKHMADPAPSITTVRPDVPPSAAEALLRAMSKVPADRHPTASAFATALTAQPEPVERRQVGRRMLLVVGVAAIAVLVGLIAVFGRGPAGLGGDEARQPRIAVLPFALSGEATDEFFADGVTEMITSELASIGGVRVVARTSAARFKDTDQSMSAVGAQLDAEYVLAGTVRMGAGTGGRRVVRVTPALIRVSDDTEVWSQPYSATLDSEIFATQDEIATAVARAMNVALVPGASAGSAPVGTDEQTLESYLLGRYVLRRRSASSLLAAAEHFRAAIATDSNFAPAWSGLADALMLHRFHYARGADSLAYERALVAANRGIALDSSSADAWASRAFGLMYGRWDYAGSAEAYRRAIALDPDHSTARIWFGELFWARGELDRAVEQLESALQSDPLSAVALNVLSDILWLRSNVSNSQTEEVLRMKRRAMELEPSWPAPYFAFWIYTSETAPDSARRYLQQGLEEAGLPRDAARRFAKVCVDAVGVRDHLAGEACKAEFQGLLPGDASMPSVIAARLDEGDSLFFYLDKGIRQRNESVMLLLGHIERMFGPDPRFADVRRRMGLPH